MADIHGFIKYKRRMPEREPPAQRVRHFREFEKDVEEEDVNQQAARCMDCGVPFCQSGCPLGNLIPEFNDAVYRQQWHKAYRLLRDTNNFPEFTGRICPAPCEAACVLGLRNDPVTIEHLEKSIVERAYQEGWVVPGPPEVRSGKNVGVIGSGPAGLAAADQLNRAGHAVTVYERNDRPGGLLRYGIPDFKLEKWVIDRRLDVMQKEGITFLTNAYVGKNIPVSELYAKHDALVLCGGATIPRDLNVEGRHLKGIHFAMEYLEQSNRAIAGDPLPEERIHARDKHVVVIGGGDTGSDCVGTANRQGARSVTQIELLAKPPDSRHPSTPWPLWPMQLKTSTSHEEGCDRKWAIMTKAFQGDADGNVEGVVVTDIQWTTEAGGAGRLSEIAGSERVIKSDLVLLAVGFLHGEREWMLDELGVEIDARGNVKCLGYQTNVPHVFSAGDMRTGQSLVVTAIAEGRKAAQQVHEFLCAAK